MRPTRIPVAVEFEKVAVHSRWMDARWQLSRIELVDADPDAVDEHAVERIDATGVLERWRYPGQLTEMHPSEGEGYWLNLNSPENGLSGVIFGWVFDQVTKMSCPWTMRAGDSWR